MAYTEEEKREHWKKLSAQGKNRFILKTGLSWGLSMVIFTTILDAFWKKNFSFSYFTSHDFLGDFIVYFVVWLLGGYFFGLHFWLRMEKKYRKGKDIKK